MTRYPLTLAEATTLCEQYDHLKGARFNSNEDDTIECLAIAPYDDINQHILMSQLGNASDYVKALEDYAGCLFDVIVIARSKTENEQLAYKRLNNYLMEMNHKVESAVYSGD